jgi:predicted DNA-binding protein YlxM (UPF0122 family)
LALSDVVASLKRKDNKFALHSVSKTEMERMYITEQLSPTVIATRFGVTPSAIYSFLKKHKISTLSPTMGANYKALAALSKETVERMYFKDEMSQTQIAKTLGVTQGAVQLFMRKHGITARTRTDGIIISRNREQFSGENNPQWNGGRHITYHGYQHIRMPDHPLADNRGYVKEHRLVWYNAYGEIPKGYHVHHRNGDKLDNRLENLELLSHRKHRDVLPELLRRVAELEEQVRRLQDELSSCRCRQ